MKIVIELKCANCEDDLAVVTVEDRDVSVPITVSRCRACGTAGELMIFPTLQDVVADRAMLEREILELRAVVRQVR